MKTRLFAVILADLVLLISPLSAEETYEILTDSAGRKLEASILKFARDGVTVKRKSDGKEFVLTYDKLSAEDRVRLQTLARESMGPNQTQGLAGQGAAPSTMVLIPAGQFQMGDSFGERPIPGTPVHQVELPRYFVDKTEITMDLWEDVRKWAIANGYAFGAGAAKGAKHPVHSVTWYDTVMWCNARSQKEGLIPCYYMDTAQTSVYKSGIVDLDNTLVKWSANGYRLPTEAEWEKAARGGLTGKRFPWGNIISHDNANYYGNPKYNDYDTCKTYTGHPDYQGEDPDTAPAGSFAANGFGIFDISGNVMEWCWDWLSSTYQGTPESLQDPKGAANGKRRIQRGGCWNSNASWCLVYSPSGKPPEYSSTYVGFRTVRR